ncbi:MAG TPA: SH3 domain-containing protein [Casimicrobiaceae bacterium]|nr:SH3 domain-containing protein [Casimicrobiaceae bacterium]
MRSRAVRAAAALLAAAAGVAAAADFRSTSEAAILYDAPSVKSKALYALGRDYPLEVIVSVEGWLKVRDAGGTVAWIEKKAISEKRTLMVRTPTAEIVAQPEPSAPVVFKAEQGVLLELADPSYATATPGWAKVRHRDGQVGFVRIQQVWGL